MTRAKSESESGPRFEPFADDASVRQIGGLSIENGRERIGLHGSLDLTRDRAGLALAHALRRTAEAIVATLEAQDLPDAVAEPEAETPQSLRNPFA